MRTRNVRRLLKHRQVLAAVGVAALLATYVWAGDSEFGSPQGNDPAAIAPDGRPVPAVPGGEDESLERLAHADEFFEARAFPGNDVPVGALAAAREEAADLPVVESVRELPASEAVIGRPLSNSALQSLTGTESELPVTWSPVGSAGTTALDCPFDSMQPPGPRCSLDGGYYNGTVPLAGRVVAIANHPTDANTAYIGAATGGVWKTTDGGVKWTSVFDGQPTLSIGAVAIDPNAPNTVYVGTGEGSGGFYFGQGVFKSTDAGATWTKVGGTRFDACHIGDIEVLAGSGIVLVAVSRQPNAFFNPNPPSGACTYDGTNSSTGVWRSSTGGTTWLLRGASAGVSDLVVDPNDSTKIYAGDYQYGLVLSVNSGFNWFINAELSALTDRGRVEVAMTADSSAIYAAVEQNSTSKLRGIYRSTNSGASFSLLSTPDDICNYPGGARGQCGYDFAIAVNPGNASEVYLAGIWLGRSTDGGTTWDYSGGSPANGTYGNSTNQVHVDHQNLSFDASNRLWVVTDGGVYRTSNGTDYTNLNGTLNLHQFQQGISVSSTGKVWGGTQDLGSARYAGGDGWTMFRNGDGGATAVDPTNENILYSTYVNLNVAKSVDGGLTNEFFEGTCMGDASCQFYAPVVIDPVRPERVYFGTNRVRKTTDGLATASVPASQFLGGNVTAIAPSASDADTVYAGTTNGGLFVTNDNFATNWVDRRAGLPNRFITDILVDPSDRDRAWVTLSGYGSGHVWATSDGGVTWVDVSGNLPDVPVNAIDADFRLATPALYIGTDIGVFASDSNGASWDRYGSNLPNVIVFDVVVNSAMNQLVAGTSGRGMFSSAIGGSPFAPTGVTAVAGNNGATVSWIAPSSSGGAPITSYTVTASPGGATCTSTQLTCIVGGLQNVEYTFTVVAQNVAGPGPASSPSNGVTPITAPGAPTSINALAGSESAQVSWTAPPTGGAPIASYTVTASPGGATCTTAGVFCSVIGLSATPYTFTVVATNAVGPGPASAPSNSVTPTAPPSAPVGVSVTPGPGSLTVAWSAPANIGGAAITGYTATASPGGATCSATGSSCVVRGLTGGTTYQVSVRATNAVGPGTVSVPVSGIPTANNAIALVAPKRYVDTRPNGETLDGLFARDGKRVGDSEYRIQVGGRGDVPGDALAVVANVTAIQAAGVGYLTVHPCVSPRPLASSLNYTVGVNLGNEIVAPLTSSGELCIYTSQGAHVTVDITGFVPSSSPIVPITPARYLDTRPNGETFDNAASTGSKPAAGSTTRLAVAGRGAVPAGASAVVVNVTAIGAAGVGYVTVHPCVEPAPNAASLNFVAGVNRGNELVATLDATGHICLFSSASTHLSVDVVAYVPAGSNLSAFGPARLLDTRPTGETIDGSSQAIGKRSGGSEFQLQVANRAGIPGGATAAILNVTVVQAEDSGFLTVHPCIDPRPNTASLNFVQGVNGGNEIIAGFDGSGRLCVFTSATAHVTVDIVGYLVS